MTDDKYNGIFYVEIMSTRKSPVLERHIYVIRGQKVMLDADLAALYGVPTKRLMEAVRRNIERFPEDFIFPLNSQENLALRSQIATSKSKNLYNSMERRGGKRYTPYVFTEHGVAMLSSVLKSRQAIEMNIHIIRTFVRLRELLATHKDLAARMEKVEAKQQRHGQVLEIIIEEIKELKTPPPAPPKRRIGFIVRD
jgi:hypothetical protein